MRTTFITLIYGSFICLLFFFFFHSMTKALCLIANSVVLELYHSFCGKNLELPEKNQHNYVYSDVVSLSALIHIETNVIHDECIIHAPLSDDEPYSHNRYTRALKIMNSNTHPRSCSLFGRISKRKK